MESTRIFYQIGEYGSLDRKAAMLRGRLRITADAMIIGHGSAADGENDQPATEVLCKNMTFPSETDRRHFLCRLIRILYRPGRSGEGQQSLTFTVSLIELAGRPIVSNNTQLVAIQRQLDEARAKAWQRSEPLAAT